MKSIEDYVLVTQNDSLESTTTSSATLSVGNGQSNLVLRTNAVQRLFSATNGWILYPTDVPEEIHNSNWAHSIYVHVSY